MIHKGLDSKPLNAFDLKVSIAIYCAYSLWMFGNVQYIHWISSSSSYKLDDWGELLNNLEQVRKWNLRPNKIVLRCNIM